MNNKNGNDHKNMIERVWNKLEHVSNTIDKYGDQMQSQLSHSNAIQSYLNKTQQEIVKVESERYALYQYIQSIKYPHNTVSFVINKLQKEMGFDVSKKTSIDPNIFKTLQAENDSLNRTLNKLMNWKHESLNQLNVDTNNPLKKELKNANKKLAIYKQKLEQIKELRKQGKVSIVSDKCDKNHQQQANIQNLNAKVTELTQENESLHIKLEKMEDIQKNQHEIADMKQMISKLEDKLKVDQQIHKSLVSDYNKVVLIKKKLEKEIESLKDDQSEQRGSVSAIKSLLLEANEDCKKFEHELNQKNNKLQQMQTEFEMVQQSNVGEITALKDQIQSLQTTNSSLTQQIETMQSKLEQKETKYEDEINAHTEKTRELSIMNEVLSRKFEEIDQRFKKQQMKSKQEQEVAEIELNSLRRKSTTLTGEIEEVTQNWQGKITKLKKEHHEIVDNLERKCKDLQKQNTELNTSFEEYKLNRARKRLSSEIQLENKINCLMKENEDLKTKHGQIVDELQKEWESLKIEVDHYKSKESTLDRLEQENKRLTEQVNDYITEKEGLLKDKMELMQTVNVCKVQYNELEKHRDSLMQISSERQERMNELKRSMHEKQNMANKEKKEIEAKMKEIQVKHQEAVNKVNEMVDVNEILERRISENITQQQDKIKLEDQLKSMTVEFDQERLSIRSTHQTNIIELNAKINALQTELQTEKQQNIELQDKIETTKQEKQNLQACIQQYMQQINKLKSDLKNENGKALSFQSKYQDLSNDLEKTNQLEHEQLKRRLSSLTSQLMSSTLQIDRRDGDIKKMQDQIEELKQSNAAFTTHHSKESKDEPQQSQSLDNDTLKEYKDEIYRLSVENEDLDGELNKLRIEYNEIQSEVSGLQQAKKKHKKKIEQLKKQRGKEMDTVAIDSESRRFSAHENARMSILKSQFKNLRMDHKKYVKFVKDLSNIVNYQDKQDLNALLVICEERLTMENDKQYRKLYEIANKSCDHLLSFISQRSLDINGAVNSLEKVILKYDGSVNEQGLNIIEITIARSLVTHIAFQIITKDNSIETKESLSVKLFHRESLSTQTNDWIEYGAEKEQRLTKVTNASQRKLRLFPFFADHIKLEIVCPNKIKSDSTIKFAINILGKSAIFE